MITLTSTIKNSRSRHLAMLCLVLLSGCTKNPVKVWQDLNSKIIEMREAESNYKALSKRHEELKKAYFELEHEHNKLLAESISKEKAEKSLKATGSKLGLESTEIHYSVPNGMSSENMATLAFEHMREKRFAEAAVTFEKLFSSPEGAAYQDAQALYSAGVAWFEVRNYHKAMENFLAARNLAKGESEKETIRKKSELWERVIERRLASEESVSKQGD